MPPEEVHFHEVGGLDAIVDVVGRAWRSSPSASLRSGQARSLSVLARCGEPTGSCPTRLQRSSSCSWVRPSAGAAREEELTTPTGAALLAALAESFGPLPPMRIRAAVTGPGAATSTARQTCSRCVIGEMETEPAARGPGSHQELVVLEANVDDVTGEVLAHTVGVLMRAGALDAWLVPVVAKKGRPAPHCQRAGRARGPLPGWPTVLTQETGTLGFREHFVARSALARQLLEVEVGGERVRVKAGPYQLKAEHDDCARAATRLGLTLQRGGQAGRGGG